MYAAGERFYAAGSIVHFHCVFFLSKNDNIQLMHSFEVNIRICQPENSDVHRGEAEVNITFEG